MTAPLLVVAHEGERNGANRVLLDLLPALAERSAMPLQIQVRTGGPLESELRGHATAEAHREPSAVFVNSALGVGVLADLDAAIPSVVYVHEVGEALAVLSPVDRRLLAERADRVLCVSEQSKRDLIDLGVDPGALSVLAPPLSRVAPTAAAVAAAQADLHRDGIRKVVIGCGEAGWRKGTDLFVDLAGRFRNRPEIGFAWVGRRHRSVGRRLDVDVGLCRVGDRLRWVGEVIDALPLLAAADVLVLASREDPQPLVPLEAALGGTPTIGFAGTGLDDLVSRDAAMAVAYPDLDGLARAVDALLAEPAARCRLAERAAEILVRERRPEPVVTAVIAALERSRPPYRVPGRAATGEARAGEGSASPGGGEG